MLLHAGRSRLLGSPSAAGRAHRERNILLRAGHRFHQIRPSCAGAASLNVSGERGPAHGYASCGRIPPGECRERGAPMGRGVDWLHISAADVSIESDSAGCCLPTSRAGALRPPNRRGSPWRERTESSQPFSPSPLSTAAASTVEPRRARRVALVAQTEPPLPLPRRRPWSLPSPTASDAALLWW